MPINFWRHFISSCLLLVFFSCSSSDNNENNEEPGSHFTSETAVEEVDAEEIHEVIFFDNLKFVLKEGLEVFEDKELTSDIVQSLSIGDTINYLDELGDVIVDAEWYGVVATTMMVKIMLADGTIGWTYNHLIGSKDDLERQILVAERRTKNPILAEFEGTFIRLNFQEEKKNYHIFENCECGFDYFAVSFWEEQPTITIFKDCGGPSIKVTDVEQKSNKGLKISGYSYPDNPYVLNFKFIELEGKKILEYSIGDSSANIVLAVPQILRKGFETIEEDCDGIYDDY